MSMATAGCVVPVARLLNDEYAYCAEIKIYAPRIYAIGRREKMARRPMSAEPNIKSDPGSGTAEIVPE